MKIKRQKIKQRVIKLNLDNTFDETTLTREGGKITDNGGTVIFTPRHVFVERKKRPLKARRRIVIFAEGTREPLKFKEVELPKGEVDETGKPKLKMDDINPYWTQGEAKEFVNKETADSLKKHKPMTWAQFIILLIPIVVCLLILLKIASQVGAL